jgi:hypothetical protein
MRKCLALAIGVAVCASSGCQRTHGQDYRGERAHALANLEEQWARLGDTVMAMDHEDWVHAVRSEQELHLLEQHRRQVQDAPVPMVAVSAAEEDPPGRHSRALGATYLLAYFKTEKALPLLREALLAERYFNGWVRPDCSEEGPHLWDNQYPHRVALIRAIETLSDQPLRKAARLQKNDRHVLEMEAAQAGTTGNCAAKWLLQKLTPPSGTE